MCEEGFNTGGRVWPPLAGLDSHREAAGVLVVVGEAGTFLSPTSPAPLFVCLQVGAVGPVLPALETKGLHAERLGGGQSDSSTDTREQHKMQKWCHLFVRAH